MNDQKMSEADAQQSDDQQQVSQDESDSQDQAQAGTTDGSSVDEHLVNEESGEAAVSVEGLQFELAILKEALEMEKDKSIRAQAEVENIRRRSSKEQMNTRKFAVEGFASELLAVKDSLDLAGQVELSENNQDVIAKMQEGLALTLKQLDTVFDKFSIQTIAPDRGEKLNPDLHQAMTIQESDEVQANCVLSVIQKGYQLHDRLLRPAMVIIARNAEKKTDESE